MENMRNEIAVFENEEFGSVRAINVEDETWFIAADVCKILEHKNVSVAIEGIDDDEKAKFNLGLSGGSINCVNEYGLYTLILRSRKPEAKAFRRWITHNVIPSIRKHGAYITDELLSRLKTGEETIDKLTDALITEYQTIEKATRVVKALAPKAEFYDTFIDPKCCTNIRTTAKELQISEKKFCRFLLTAKYMYRCPAGNLMPYTKPENDGLFRVKDYCRNGHFGSYALITPEGKNLFSRLTETVNNTI